MQDFLNYENIPAYLSGTKWKFAFIDISVYKNKTYIMRIAQPV
jgi:hypothetical protein